MRLRKRGEIMLNVNMLKGKIIEKGENIDSVSSKIGINAATFYRKMKNNSFEIGEADKIVRALSLSNEEAIAIFFSNVVADMRLLTEQED